jgi:hypothetical protein
MPRIPLIGGAYNGPSYTANAQRCINLYPEINPERSRPPVPVTHYPRPGSTALSVPPVQGIGRCIYTATNDNVFAVCGQALYYINPDYVYVRIGLLPAVGTTPVYIADNGATAIVVDGSNSGLTIDLLNHNVSPYGDPNFVGSDRVDFLDYFLIFNKPGTRDWYCTDNNAITIQPLAFGIKSAYADPILSCVAWQRQVIVMGSQKAEVWSNAGSVPFPFQINPGAMIEYGCIAKYSIATQDVDIYWLGRDNKTGGRVVYRASANSMTDRISTHAMEKEFLKYLKVDDAIGNCYQIRGHMFYRLHFPTADKTWVYDKATGQWFEDNWIDGNGVLHRSRIGFSTFGYGIVLGLDWQTGALYKVDEENFTDNGKAITCIRAFPHIIGDNYERASVRRIMADMEVGATAGIIAVPQPGPPVVEPPTVYLRVSHNGGATYADAIGVALGAQGQYRFVPTWNNLGMARDFVFELSWSTPMQTALNGVFIPEDAIEMHES